MPNINYNYFSFPYNITKNIKKDIYFKKELFYI